MQKQNKVAEKVEDSEMSRPKGSINKVKRGDKMPKQLMATPKQRVIKALTKQMMIALNEFTYYQTRIKEELNKGNNSEKEN